MSRALGHRPLLIAFVFPTLLMAACVLSVIPASAWGQEAADATQVANQVAEPARSPGFIYLPYRDLKAVFEKQTASAIVPYADYLSLLDRVFQTVPGPAQPPVSAAIVSAHYQASVEEDLAKVRAKLSIQVLREGWSEIPLSWGEASISSISCETCDVLLRATGAGLYAVGLNKIGQHEIILELNATVRSSPEGRSLALTVPAVGITQFDLQVPEANQELSLEPAAVVLPTPETNASEKTPEGSHLSALVGSTNLITAKWHSSTGARPEMELLASAVNATAVTLQDGLVYTDCWLTFEVLRGRQETARFVVPTGDRILDVSSASRLKTWTVSEEDQGQVVTVEFAEGFTDRVTLEIHTERDATPDTNALLGRTDAKTVGIHALDVVRESGVISLQAGPELELVVESQQGLSRVGEEAADAHIRRPTASYFRFFNPSAAQLQALARPLVAKIQATNVSYVLLREDQIRLDANIGLQIERAGVFDLQFRLPEKFVVQKVHCANLKEFVVSEDQQTLTIVLNAKTRGQVIVELSLIQPLTNQEIVGDWVIDPVEPFRCDLETGSLYLFAPESLEVAAKEAELVSVQPNPSPVALKMAGGQLISSWLYYRRPVSLPLTITRKPTRLTAFVATHLDAKPDALSVHSQIDFQVDYAGLDTYRFAVPEASADRVQISLGRGKNLPTIQQKTRAAAATEGWVTWTVQLQREVSGLVPLEVSYDLPSNWADTSNRQQLSVSVPRALPPKDSSPDEANTVTLSRVVGEISLSKDRSVAVVPTATGADVEQIDIRELRDTSAESLAAYRYYQQPVTVELELSRLAIQNVVETVISRSLVEVVLDRSGVATVRSRYQLRTSERQRLRIDLPVGLEPLGVLVDQKTVALEKLAGVKAANGWEAFAINVARSQSSDESFGIALLYRIGFEPVPFASRGGELMLRLPQFGGENPTDVVVQQQRVAVWSPDDYAFVGTPKDFEREQSSNWLAFWRMPRAKDLESWIGVSSAGVFDFPIEGRPHLYGQMGATPVLTLWWWHLPFYTAFATFVLVCIALILRTTTWENKISLLLILLFVAAVTALFDADLVTQALVVTGYGLMAVVAIWLLHAVLTPVRSPENRTSVPTMMQPSGGWLSPATVIPPPGIFEAFHQPPQREE